MYKYLLTCFLLYFSSPFSSAQEKQVALRFVSFPITNKSEPIELLVGEGESIEVELPTNSLSPVYKVPDLAQWSLGKLIEGAEGKKTFKSYGKINSIGTSEQLILVIRKGDTYEEGFKMIPLKYDLKDFGGGEYFMMNTTTVDIGIKLGSAQVGLKPDTYKLAKPEASEVVNGNKQIYIKVFFRNKDEMKPFYNSTWRLNEKARNLVFFYHEPHSMRIRTHTIRDYIRTR